MAVAVVDRLEAVEVAHEQAQGRLGAARASKLRVQSLVERAAVAEVRERVHACELPRLVALLLQGEALRADSPHEKCHEQGEPNPEEQLGRDLARLGAGRRV